MLILQGLWRLAHFDSSGFLFFEVSPRAFWQSFAAAVVCLPVWGLAEYQQLAGMADDKMTHFLLLEFMGYVISWLAYPLLVAKVSSLFSVQPHFYRYMTGYNWFRTVLQLIWLPLLIVTMTPGHMSPEWVANIWLLLSLVEFFYNGFLARHGLAVSRSTAYGLAAIDFLLSLLIDQMTALMPGMGALVPAS